MRFTIKILCLIALLYGGYQGFLFYKDRNDGFSVDRIESKLPNSPEWDFPITDQKLKEVNEILAQPFYYLGHGFQFYAFESSDGRFVLKFFRHQRLHPPVLFDYLPNWDIFTKIKEKKAKKRKVRVDSLFSSLKIAYQDIPEETGLIFVQLNKTKGPLRKAFLVDLQENEYQVSLDDTEFVLQHKATFVKPMIKELMKEERLEEAKERIDQLFQLLKATAQKGILDTDGALIYKNNVGYVADQAVYIDIGQFVYKDTIRTKERFILDLRRLRPLYKWLLARYPALATHFEKSQAEVIESFEDKK